MDIRPATPDDIDGIRRIQRASGRTDSERFAEDLAAAVADEDRLILVAEDGGLLGWGVTRRFTTSDGMAPAGQYLMGLAVAPEHRRRGIGTALIEARSAWIVHRGARAWTFTDSGNVASIAAHRAVGFEEAGRAHRIHGVPFTSGTGVLLVKHR